MKKFFKNSQEAFDYFDARYIERDEYHLHVNAYGHVEAIFYSNVGFKGEF